MEHEINNEKEIKRKPQQQEILYFQDFFQDTDDTGTSTTNSTSNSTRSKDDTGTSSTTMDPSEIFFELANAPIVGFKIDSKCHGKKSSSKERKGVTSSKASKDMDNNHKTTNESELPAILIKQDSTCQSHTGGIVWETAYLLACYLNEKYPTNQKNHNSTTNSKKKNPLGKTLEVGSGCGMLGLILAAGGLCKKVIMTETQDVMSNLIANVEYNTSPDKFCPSKKISARQLRWDAYKKDIQQCQLDTSTNSNDDLDPHTFDTIIGTDVIFSTTLVKPLLKTLRKMCHTESKIYLCVQVRCADSHSLFMKKASKYDFECQDCTHELHDFPSCSFGLDLECKLLCLTVIVNPKKKDIMSSRKRKYNSSNDERNKTRRTKKS